VEIRDTVHGFVEIADGSTLARVLDHPAFQRLRGIHQLAMAYLVYPGALHTRFEHSLGVLRVAQRLAERLDLDPQQKQNVMLAAMLHDIGHGPFSHVSERPLARFSGADGSPAQVETLHEQVTLEIVRGVLLPGGVINEGQCQALENILSPGTLKRETIERQIVSGQLDADMLDYLLRDSLYCGVRYGVYDLDRILQAVTRVEDDEGEHVAIREEDVAAVDQLIIAKHNMNANVYYHRIRRVTDAMLERAVVMAVEEGDKQLASLYTHRADDPAWVHQWVAWDDRSVRDHVAPRGGPSGDLMGRLLHRHLPKEVFREPAARCDTSVLASLANEAGGPGEVDRRVAEAVGCAAHLVFANVFHARSPRPDPNRARLDPQAIRVRLRDGGADVYERRSQFFRHRELAAEAHLCVFVPIDDVDPARKAERYGERRRIVSEVVGFEKEGS
jgi:HD superfamily phosphohydrolase